MRLRTYATAKISGCRVTGAELEYEGSITLGESLLSWSGIGELELVHVNNLETGAHWETYVIRGENTEVRLNGPPAKLFSVGDRVVIVRYEQLDHHPGAIQLVRYQDGRLESAERKKVGT